MSQLNCATALLLKKIMHIYHLGILQEPPKRLTGGFLHEVYLVTTANKRYVIKLLNPNIMLRKTALANYHQAEKLEVVLEQQKFSIVAALSFNQQKMQEIEGRFFYLFDWNPGVALNNQQITKIHCVKMGQFLARLHQLEQKVAPLQLESVLIDWNFYAAQLQKVNGIFYQKFVQLLPTLIQLQEQGNQAREKLPSLLAICHQDLDPKNVLWSGSDYRVIDLECLTYTSPFLEVLEQAMRWSGFEQGELNLSLFTTFMTAYQQGQPKFSIDWQVVYESNLAQLSWLAFNLNRVLGIESDSDEQEIGLSEAHKVLEQIAYYVEIKENILSQLAKFKD